MSQLITGGVFFVALIVVAHYAERMRAWQLCASLVVLVLLCFAFGEASAATIDTTDVCTVRTICKPLHPKVHKPKPRPVRLDLMCYELVLVLNPWPEIPLSLNLPPETIAPPDPDDTPEPEPTVAPAPATQSGGDSGGGGGGGVGWGYYAPPRDIVVPRLGDPSRLNAPELDPGAGLAAVLLLAGWLAIIRGRRP